MSISDDDVVIHMTLFLSCDDGSIMKVPDVVISFAGRDFGSRLITIPRDRFRFLPPTCPHVSVRDFGSRLITTSRGCFASSGSGFVRPRSGSGFYPLPSRRLSSSIFSQLYVTM